MIKYPGDSKTIVELLSWRAKNQLDGLAYQFLDDGEREGERYTYSELDRRARSIAAHLQSLNLKGERAILVFDNDLEYIAVFYGCLYAGVISAPLHPPGRNKSMYRISSVTADAGAKVILTTTQLKNNLSEQFLKDPILKDLDWIPTDQIKDDTADGWIDPGIKNDDTAFLQYTSGSTGSPKGVMVTHNNLLYNIYSTVSRYKILENDLSRNDSLVTWAPLFHDLGLIFCTLIPLFVGIPCYMMTPEAFIQRPIRWLKTISKYKSTVSGAPNFAYELLINRVSKEEIKTLDLKSWDIAMNGSEPVRADTLIRFAEYFKPAGFKAHYFSSAWGQAETTIIITTTDKDLAPVIKNFNKEKLEKDKVVEVDYDNPDGTKLVGHEMGMLDAKVIIVHPKKLTLCKPDEVGEIWVSGSTVTPGYWNKPEVNEETFNAYIKDTGEGPFLRTGDLGFIHEDQLYITGRYNDIIIIRGQNHYPQDIEFIVEKSHQALRLGCVAAFPIDAEGEEQLAIVQEIQKKYLNNFDPDEVCKAIRKAVSEEHNLNVYAIQLLETGTVRKTSSGKIQRKENRQSYLNGTLSVIAEWKQGMTKAVFSKSLNKSTEEIQKTLTTNEEEKLNLKDWLINKVSELLKVPAESIDVNESFASYGMDSLRAVQLSGDLGGFLKKKLPATLAYNYPSVNLLLNYINKDSLSPQSKDEIKKEKISDEPIAIIGMSCRFPNADNISEFWKLLYEGKDAIKKFPENRWNVVNPENLNGTITYGGYLDEVHKFDPQFFGISPREAIQIDPQQRLFLEVSLEALEDSGINPAELKGKNVGVFAGVCSFDYARFTVGEKNLLDAYTGPGTSLSIVANRLSYILDFRGPSISIDTACSSSLVAVHQACQSLRREESSIAIVGGVNLILSLDFSSVFTQGDYLSEDGKCKAFDENANGYVRGEGCGVIILKPLSKAIHDGDRILALIKGSAINQDGKSNGLTAPNGPSQEDVIRQALKDANLSPSNISYIEAHGTGTPLGDPIEVNSLKSVLTEGRKEDNTCWIGSVKTNFGHLEGAAGIAGVIKTILSLQNKIIPQHLNFKKLNPEIFIEGTPIKIVTERTEWKSDKGKRYAGVSSFGFGGTNAHVILQEAPETKSISSSTLRPFNIFTLSAKNENALIELSNKYIEFLNFNNNLKLEDICYTANIGRALLNHRLAIVCSTIDDLKKKLNNFKNRKSSLDVIQGVIKINYNAKIAFLFPGQGAQYIGMGKELYDTHLLFRKTINRCDEILCNYLEKPLLEVLFYEKDESINPINETMYTQPALFAIEYALAELWMSWGIKPAVMMGHSAGEYVAACLSGVFSLEDGLKLVTERGRLMETLTRDGEMYTIFADEKTVKQAINDFEDSVSIASINSPIKTVISGNKNALAKILPLFDSRQIEYKKINVSIASHSPLMNSMIEEFRKVCNEVKYSSPKISVVSNITGEVVSDRISNADYWCDHIMSTVRFSDGIKSCVKHGCDIFIDLGPKPTSIGVGQETVLDPKITWLASIKKNFTIWESMLQCLATLYVKGITIEWTGFNKGYSNSKISLPTYPFQRQRYWIEDLKSNKPKVFSFDNVNGNPLLGQRLSLATKKEIIFNTQVSRDNPSFLKDHSIYGRAVFPTTGYIEIAMSASKKILKTKDVKIKGLILHSAFLLEEDEVYNVQIIITQSENKSYSFQIFSSILIESNVDSDWTLHATGKIVKAIKEKKIINEDLKKIKSEFKEKFPVEKFYSTTNRLGIQYYSSFQAVKELWVNNKEALAHIEMTDEIKNEIRKYNFHPVLLDACLHTSFALLLNKMNSEVIYLPIGVESVELFDKSENELWSILTYDSIDNKKILNANLKVLSSEGKVIANIKGIQLKEVNRKDFIESSSKYLNDWLYEIEWIKKESDEKSEISRLIPEPKNIKEQVRQTLNEILKGDDLRNYKKGIDKLELVSVGYIVNAFDELGFNFEIGKSFNENDLAKELNIANQHLRLFERLLRILEEEKILSNSNGNWKFVKKSNYEFLQNDVEKMLKENSEVAAEITLLSKCGSVLSKVLKGEVDPLQLLFPDGDFTSLVNLYEDSPGFEVMNTLIQNLITHSLINLTGGRKIKILEIGAGIGATTSYALKNLPEEKVEYTFTDISQLFLAKAKEKFSKHKNVKYQVLDIEKSPIEQNFYSHSYDIIIASNVIHATKDLNESTMHIKELLSPNGLLVLTEATEIQRWVDLVFGLTEGWWRFNDHDLRPDYALLSDKKWIEFLKRNGFEDIEIITPINKSNKSLTAQSIVIAKRSELSETKPVESGHWVIFSDERSVGYDLRNELIKEGNTCYLVHKGEKFEKLDECSFKINSNDKKDYQNLFKNILSSGNKNLKGVIHLWSLDNYKKTIQDKDVEKLSNAGCHSVLNILQAIPQIQFPKSASLYLVTQDAQAVNGNENVEGLTQSPLWGMGKVIAIEHPELNCSIIDLDGEYTNSHVKKLLQVIQTKSYENQIAIRNGDIFIPKLIRSNSSSDNSIEISDDGTYLITGGTKGLGLLFAKWLTDKGAKHLVLMGRNKVSDKNKKLIEEIKLHGVDVKIIYADVTKKNEIERVLFEINQSKFSLRGIIHSVGVLDDGVLLNQTQERFDKVMAPKILGSWYLSDLTKDLELDFFIMFSSIASLLGSAGQGNHSASNAFLDAFAFYRRAKGLPGLSINWGVWSEIGSAASIGADKQKKIAGLGVINPNDGMKLFERILQKNVPQVGAINIEWERFVQKNSSSGIVPFISELLKKKTEKELTEKAPDQQANVLEEFKKTDKENQTELLENYFQNLVTHILGLQDEIVEVEQPLNTMGLDSLMAIELKNNVNIELGVDLNLVRYMEETNIKQLANELREQILINIGKQKSSDGKGGEDKLSDQDQTRELLVNLENLSEEKLDQLLNETK